MWILSFLPDWIFHAIVIAGLVAVIVGTFLKSIPIINNYSLPIKVIGYIVLALGIFLEGGLNNEKVWQARVKEVEAKLAIAEQQSKEENVKIETKVITKTQVIRTRGKDIVKYVDREIVKYDTKFAPGGVCEIPKEFVKAHNDAAEAPK
jgi:energy-coupling factor transporter transmembrane protein EcfT